MVCLLGGMLGSGFCTAGEEGHNQDATGRALQGGVSCWPRLACEGAEWVEAPVYSARQGCPVPATEDPVSVGRLGTTCGVDPSAVVNLGVALGGLGETSGRALSGDRKK